MIHLDEERNVVEWIDSEEPGSHWSAASSAHRPKVDNGFSAVGRSASSTRGRCLQRPYTGLAIVAGLGGVGVVGVLAAGTGDWMLAVARATAFASNPDMADAVAGAGWLAPSIRGGSFGDAIGVAIAALTVVALVALRVWQHFETGTRQSADDSAGVYKIVTNQTNADDRRPVAWHRWAPSPACERVKTLVCG